MKIKLKKTLQCYISLKFTETSIFQLILSLIYSNSGIYYVCILIIWGGLKPLSAKQAEVHKIKAGRYSQVVFAPFAKKSIACLQHDHMTD